jgi:glutaredoxin
MTKPIVEVYARKDCSFCGFAKEAICTICTEARDLIRRVGLDMPFHFKEVDVSSSEDLFRRFKDDIPTVFINGAKAFKFKVDEAEFRKKLRIEFIKAGIKRLNIKKQRYRD